MRAIHRIAPNLAFERVLEVGGGESGLTSLLYPSAKIVNLDIDDRAARSSQNQQSNVSFIQGDATEMAFADSIFDAVTLFDVLEHIPDDRRVAKEVLRVVRPGGWIIVSVPTKEWRFPRYRAFRPICPAEKELTSVWGHVRRGYDLGELEELFRMPALASGSFINCITVIAHDISFSFLPRAIRIALHILLAPLTWTAYWLHGSETKGSQIVAVWQRKVETDLPLSSTAPS